MDIICFFLSEMENVQTKNQYVLLTLFIFFFCVFLTNILRWVSKINKKVFSIYIIFCLIVVFTITAVKNILYCLYKSTH